MNKYIIRERFAPEETYEGWNSYQAVERWAEDRCEKVLIQSDRKPIEVMVTTPDGQEIDMMVSGRIKAVFSSWLKLPEKEK